MSLQINKNGSSKNRLSKSPKDKGKIVRVPIRTDIKVSDVQ